MLTLTENNENIDIRGLCRLSVTYINIPILLLDPADLSYMCLGVCV